ncbi:hypothetical protein IKF73_02535 [Candidatus Saccharibacteria bacterium]|nr:hypothetical protein [Candidatus Saccharibacteria bacterium]
MEQNLENVSDEIVKASVSASNSVPATPAKSKGLVLAVVFFALLAVAGIGFGVYGMFFKTIPNCLDNCSQDTPPATNAGQNTDSNAPSISDVKQILENKYGFKEMQYTFKSGIMSEAIWDHMDNFDDTAKLVYTIKTLENSLPELDPTTFPEIIKTIDYDTLNESYKRYFGNEHDILKNDQEIDVLYDAIVKIHYLPESDNFEIYFADGLGGGTFTVRLNKINEVVGTDENFSAIILSTTIDNYVAQSVNEPIERWGIGSENETYVMYMPESQIQEIQENLSAYKLNFIKESDEYKLISIERQ